MCIHVYIYVYIDIDSNIYTYIRRLIMRKQNTVKKPGNLRKNKKSLKRKEKDDCFRNASSVTLVCRSSEYGY